MTSGRGQGGPKAILFSHELEVLQMSGRDSGVGWAWLHDEQDGIPDVIHLAPLDRGHPCPGAKALRLEWRLNPGNGERLSPAVPGEAAVWIDTLSEPAAATCLIRLQGGGSHACRTEIVQTGVRTFSRNVPVLETRALESASVLCIGLGSGGSAVVDQLARSGVGRFILWDRDRLEPHNVSRHVCTLSDLGRKKVLAVRDHILGINPACRVECYHEDAVASAVQPGGNLHRAIGESDCILVGTDNNASRFAVNQLAWRQGKPSLYARAFARASGGDVIQVVPGETPCFACHLAGHTTEEEVSSERDAVRVSYSDRPVPIEPGLSIDILPIANMMARLCLLRLCLSLGGPLGRFAGEMSAPLYLWSNRREGQFAEWKPMERSFDRLSVLRWYAIAVPRNEECSVCGIPSSS